MLINIGSFSAETGDVVDLLLACHERIIIPRLSGRDAALDRTFESIRREHSAHDHDLKSLLKICGNLQASPEPAPETVLPAIRSLVN
jgi:hypothetical protein